MHFQSLNQMPAMSCIYFETVTSEGDEYQRSCRCSDRAEFNVYIQSEVTLLTRTFKYRMNM